MSTKTSNSTIFNKSLLEYKNIIDTDISSYSKHVKSATLKQYGANARLETDAFLDILDRGGKRIRGSLVMVGYEMSGGKNTDMIIQVARAIEMIHAYILIIDDIQDRSKIRRGGPTAHKQIARYHEEHQLADNSDHFGISIALNSAIAGAHAAQMILANLDAPENLRLSVLSIVNRTMLITAHGQTNDIMNEVVAEVDPENIERVLEWKTAHYSFLNPLHVGMVLAGADCHDTDAITDYAMHTGKAFQITDDILGVFGNEQDSGKSPLDDIREGKRTVLTAYALEHASSSDKNFLIQMLGNHDLSPAEFDRCKVIIERTGALKHSQDVAKNHIQKALLSLDKNKSIWNDEGVMFLNGLADFILTRTT